LIYSSNPITDHCALSPALCASVVATAPDDASPPVETQTAPRPTHVAPSAPAQPVPAAAPPDKSAPHPYVLELNCDPPTVTVGNTDPGRNPVTSLDVWYDGADWLVTYRFANGKSVSRGQQYEVTDASNRRGDIKWSGALRANSNLHMVGQILWNSHANAFGYRERIYDDIKGGQLVTETFATQCQTLRSPTKPVASTNPDATAVPIFQRGDAVLVDVTLGDLQPAPMLIDTGCTNMTVSRFYADALMRRGQATYLGTTQVTLADGSMQRTEVIRIAEVKIGEHVLTNVTATLTPDGADMLLGFAVLNEIGRFTIDTVNKQLIFEPNT
jgi:hypothetical protein